MTAEGGRHIWSKPHAAASADRAGSEVVLESEHHLTRPDLRPRNLAEGRRAEHGVGIAEDWFVQNVLGLDSNLQPLPIWSGDFLTHNGVEDLDAR
jgi:hypothetical protein